MFSRWWGVDGCIAYRGVMETWSWVLGPYWGNFPEWWTQSLHGDLGLGYTTGHLLVSLTATIFVGPSIAKFEDMVVFSFAFLRGIGKCLHFLF